MLYKIRPYVTKDILKLLFNTLIYPHLTYGIEIWGSASNSHLNKVLIAQKRLVRMITHKDIRQANYFLTHSNPLFHQLGILKIHDVHTLSLSKFVYKTLEGSVPSNFSNWFRFATQIHCYRTRANFNYSTRSQTNILYVPHARTTHYGLNKTKVQGPRIWNNIPQNIRDKKSIIQFVSSLRSNLFGKYIHQ